MNIVSQLIYIKAEIRITGGSIVSAKLVIQIALMLQIFFLFVAGSKYIKVLEKESVSDEIKALYASHNIILIMFSLVLLVAFVAFAL